MKRKIINQAFIERCNKLKGEKGFSLEAIENEIGISKGSMSKYMNGIHLPNSEVVRLLSKYWGVSADYLLGSSDERNNEMSDGKTIPIGYIKIIQNAIEARITEDEFRDILETAIKFKGR
jgi:transcriptional regulator with XRE-family HTH domain